MPRETEIKLKIDDVKSFQRALRKIGAKDVGLGRVHEENVIFDTPEGEVGKRGQVLRIRTETGSKRGKNRRFTKRFLLTFKRPALPEVPGEGQPPEGTAYKVREEMEVEITEAEILTKIFEGLGMKGWFRYEKYRTTYKIAGSKKWAKGLLVEMDETPIGVFAELEGPPEAIDQAAQELGFSKNDYILRNYLSLYVEDCRERGVEPSDMVFRKRTAGQK
jgi:adenylate cyclase class 2